MSFCAAPSHRSHPPIPQATTQPQYNFKSSHPKEQYKCQSQSIHLSFKCVHISRWGEREWRQQAEKKLIQWLNTRIYIIPYRIFIQGIEAFHISNTSAFSRTFHRINTCSITNIFILQIQVLLLSCFLRPFSRLAQQKYVFLLCSPSPYSSYRLCNAAHEWAIKPLVHGTHWRSND